VADFVSEVGDEKVKSLKKLERVKGIEPSSSAWKAVALPLSYTRRTRSTFTGNPARLRCFATSARQPSRTLAAEP
jgi:hypothetical protein